MHILFCCTILNVNSVAKFHCKIVSFAENDNYVTITDFKLCRYCKKVLSMNREILFCALFYS